MLTWSSRRAREEKREACVVDREPNRDLDVVMCFSLPDEALGEKQCSNPAMKEERHSRLRGRDRLSQATWHLAE